MVEPGYEGATDEALYKRVRWKAKYQETEEYKQFLSRVAALREADEQPVLPVAPDATDRTISRRKWNIASKEWQIAVRGFLEALDARQ